MRPRRVRFVTESLTTRQRPPLPPVTCPHSLDNKVGATTRCTATRKFNGKTKTLGITAKTTSKHGSSYHLDYQTTGFE